MKRSTKPAAMLEQLAVPQQELLGGVYSFDHEALFTEARSGGRLAGQVAELVHACFADELHCKRSQFHFSGFAQLLISEGKTLVGSNADVRNIRDCANTMNMNVMAERLVYKDFYAKLELAVHKLEEVRGGVTFTFNGRSTRMDKDRKKKDIIVSVLGLHIRSMADTLEQYKSAIEALTEHHDKLRAICDPPQIAKEPSLPKALKL